MNAQVGRCCADQNLMASFQLPDAMERFSRSIAPRLVRSSVVVDGRNVGVVTAGDGIPLVMVHGFGVESMLYAQMLSRIATLGFRVIGIDIAGHGDSDPIGIVPTIDGFAEMIDAALDQLDVNEAVFVGHSMGGRLVAELCAARPERAIALILLDAIVGAPWDALRPWLRWCPPALGLYGLGGAIDVASTLPARIDKRQAFKITRRVRSSVVQLITEPWHGLMAGAAVLRASSSADVLDRVGAANIASFVVHGDRDLLVPTVASLDAAHRLHATYVTVHTGRHSWMIRDPNALPTIIAALLDGTLGCAIKSRGLRIDSVSPVATPRLKFTIDR